MLALKIFKGTPGPDWDVRYQGLVKLQEPAPPRGRNIVCSKSRFGWVQTHTPNFLDSGPKFTGLVSSNVRGIGLDQAAFRFWISWVVAEIFAIKVGSWVKSCQILHVFGPPNFLGERPPNFWTCIIKLMQILIMWQNFTSIGRRSSEILWRIKKTSRLKQKAFGTNVPGGLKRMESKKGTNNCLCTKCT